MNQHLSLNGLKGGRIPTGQPCPFLDKCVALNNDCPTAFNAYDKPFDCGAARMQSLIILRFRK